MPRAQTEKDFLGEFDADIASLRGVGVVIVDALAFSIELISE